MNSQAERVCVVCDTPTESTTQGELGDRTGPICPDCAYHCDGNVTHGTS